MSVVVCHIWMCYPCTYYEWLVSCTNLLEKVSLFLLKLPFPRTAGCHYHDSVYNLVTCQHTYRAVVLAHRDTKGRSLGHYSLVSCLTTLTIPPM